MEAIFKQYYLRNKSVYNATKGKQEVALAAELATILQCRTEVACNFNLGRIDLLSNTWLIEAKYEGSTALKGALGQLLVYSAAMRFKGNLGLAIIGKTKVQPGICEFCRLNRISIFYYNLNARQWSILVNYML